jgi:hypothetical protein
MNQALKNQNHPWNLLHIFQILMVVTAPILANSPAHAFGLRDVETIEVEGKLISNFSCSNEGHTILREFDNRYFKLYKGIWKTSPGTVVVTAISNADESFIRPRFVGVDPTPRLIEDGLEQRTIQVAIFSSEVRISNKDGTPLIPSRKSPAGNTLSPIQELKTFVICSGELIQDSNW